MTDDGTARTGAGERATTHLATVTGDAPAAVLLVDLTSRQVVFANPVARQLAPDVGLPTGLDAWADAAQLRDLDGTELSDTEHPLSRVARSEPVAGRAVSAARGSDLGERRQPLWAVALPMEGAPMLDRHALVVLLSVHDEGAMLAAVEAAQAAEHAEDDDDAATAADADGSPGPDGFDGPPSGLRERAVLATGLSFTVADARAEDLPLVWVNGAFTATTGYGFDDVVGRNCRFLQGPGTDPAATREMHRALLAGEPTTVTLLNYRRDGLAFWNQVSLSPVHDADGSLTHYVGIQTDVSGRVEADQARERALAAERAARELAEEARREAERARRVSEEMLERVEQAQVRLDLLAEATTQLTGTLEVGEARRRLVDLVVPELADWVLLLSVNDGGEVQHVGAAHADPGLHAGMQAYARQVAAQIRPGPLDALLLGGRGPRIVADFGGDAARELRRGWVRDPALLAASDGLGASSVMLVPVPGRRLVDDVLVLVRGPASPPYVEEDLRTAADLGQRAGLLLDNARLFAAQQHVVTALQRGLQPDVGELAHALPGVRVAARFRAGPAVTPSALHDLALTGTSALALSVGDLAGHQLLTAAAAGQVRGLLHASADALDDGPAAVLGRLDALVTSLGLSTVASMVHAQLRSAVDGAVDGGRRWQLRWSSAGHPPLLLREPGGGVRTLWATGPDDAGDDVGAAGRVGEPGDPGDPGDDAVPAADPLLGVGGWAGQPRRERTVELAPGSVVLAYGEGLLPRPTADLAVRIRLLADVLAHAPADPDGICAAVVDRLADGRAHEDVALVAVTLG